jgi:TPP-dependent pyruvate/acetoin dehydrogenase alpha subunit
VRADTTASPVPDLDGLKDIYRRMHTIAFGNQRAYADVRSGLLKAAFYPARGLEGVCAALSLVMRPEDYMISTYRNLGDAVAKNVNLREIAAELAGRITGTSKGKGGPMHLADPSVGFMATTGVVGSGVPIAVGLALSSKLKDEDQVTFVTFGDGATSIGAFHEGMNLAATWKVPVVFICQNNQWGEHTPITDYTAAPDLAARARAYGMTGLQVDGFDVLATWRTFTEAAEQCRTGNGPVFVEAITYRLGGHTSTADFTYMPKDVLAAARERDPLVTFRHWLVTAGHLSQEDLHEIEAAAKAAIEDAFDFAYASEVTPLKELYVDVIADPAAVEGK